MEKSLKSIIGSMARSEFLDHYINNNPIVTHGLSDLVTEFRKLSLLKNLDSLFDLWPGDVTAYLPGIADEGNSKKVNVDEAKKLFQNGSGLCFDDANIYSKILNEWPQAIRRDLGLSNLTYCRSLIYAIKEGRGTAPHFDQNINFVIQVSGTKKWWIAPNKHVENPMSRHTIGIDIDPELSSYTNSMPDEFPDDGVEYILEPGSMLFVPRGSWHKTQATSDAVSLNFTFTAPTWIDIFTSVVRGHLAQSSEWRETANFVNDNELQDLAFQRFDSLLRELVQETPNWNARSILEVTEMK